MLIIIIMIIVIIYADIWLLLLRLSVKMKGFDAWDAQKRKCADFQIAG